MQHTHTLNSTDRIQILKTMSDEDTLQTPDGLQKFHEHRPQ